MQHTPEQLQSNLLSALDHDYEVRDMSTVLQVVSLLEKANITRDDLERTRMGFHVNKLRRQSQKNHKELSKRLKQLVKEWQKLLHFPVNGSSLRKTTSPAVAVSQQTARSNCSTPTTNGLTKSIPKLTISLSRKRTAVDNDINDVSNKKIINSQPPSPADTTSSGGTSILRTNQSINGLSNRRTVPSTVELLSGFKNLSASNSTVKKIKNNCIEKERDENISIVPPGARPRPRKTPKPVLQSCDDPPAATTESILAAKQKMVAEYVQSSPSRPPSGFSDHNDDVESPEHSPIQDDETSTSQSTSRLATPEPIINPFSLLPPVDFSVLEQDILDEPDYLNRSDNLTPRDFDDCGQFDNNGEWRQWTDIVTVKSSDDRILHLYPYVDID